MIAETIEDEVHTVDAFHRGSFHLVQPARRGHRAGTDAMMLAASVPSAFSGRLADLGAGAGAAALAVAARCPGARVTLIENDSEMAEFARRSLAHPGNAGIAARCALMEMDIRLSDRERREAGLADQSFDWAIMNPPFNPASDRPSPDDLRRRAHLMEDPLLFDSWLRMASRIVRPGGGVAIIARPQSLQSILSAMDGRFGSQMVKGLHPREDRPAKRVIVRAMRGGSASLSIMPPLVMHAPGGHGFSPEADAISNGCASLFGD